MPVPASASVARFVALAKAAIERPGVPPEVAEELRAAVAEVVALVEAQAEKIERLGKGLREGAAHSAKKRTSDREPWLAVALDCVHRNVGTSGSFRAFVAHVQTKLTGDPEPTYPAVRTHLQRRLPPEVMALWRKG